MPAVVPVPKSKQIRKKSHQRRAQEKQEKKGWNCPICGRNMLVLYEDPFFKNILRLSGTALKVRIFAEGNYNFDVYAQ
jgi:transposase-like protein